jgi:RNA polymerase sigma factor (TIGR02999 family)
MPRVYEELRRLAHAEARRSRSVVLQPTVLVHETFLRLNRQRSGGWSDRASFMGVAARVMRQVLVDDARARQAQKRGGGREHLELEPAMIQVEDRVLDLLQVDELLAGLGRLDADSARCAEWIVFGGLSIADCARELGCSVRSVDRLWRFARAYLLRHGEWSSVPPPAPPPPTEASPSQT